MKKLALAALLSSSALAGNPDLVPEIMTCTLEGENIGAYEFDIESGFYKESEYWHGYRNDAKGEIVAVQRTGAGVEVGIEMGHKYLTYVFYQDQHILYSFQQVNGIIKHASRVVRKHQDQICLYTYSK